MSGFGIAHISHFVFHKILFFPFESVFMQPGSSFFGNQIERGGRIYLLYGTHIFRAFRTKSNECQRPFLERHIRIGEHILGVYFFS